MNNDKEYMKELQPAIDCSAVSQLPSIDSKDLSSETLLLISQPSYKQETDTGYISRYAKLEDLVEYNREKLDIYAISAELQRKFDLTAVQPSSIISCQNLENPYIISSFHYDGITLSTVEGYLLKDVIIDILSTQLDIIIPSQLTYKMSYDTELDKLVLSNESTSNPITSAVDITAVIEDALSDMLSTSMLSNVTINKAGDTLYLHFVVTTPSGTTLKKIKINIKNIIPLYEFGDGLSVVYKDDDDESERHIIVNADPALQLIDELSSRLIELESIVAELSVKNFITQEMS